MGSYFSKKQKPKEMPFEQIERNVETLDPKTYPTFDKTLDWSKTKHVYSDYLCVSEKYVSYGLIGLLFVFFLACSFWGFKTSTDTKVDHSAFVDVLNQEIQIGEDVQ
jgi:hypothetical protein